MEMPDNFHSKQGEHFFICNASFVSAEHSSSTDLGCSVDLWEGNFKAPIPLCLLIAIPLIMPLFIILGKLSDKAIEKMKEAKKRDLKAEQIIHAAGGTLLSHYYTFGRYDFVTIVELPSTEVLAKVVVEIAKCGTVSTETMAAILPEQMYAMAKGT